MKHVYGFETTVSKRTLPYAHLLVEILSEWPSATEPVKNVFDVLGGSAIFRLLDCTKRQRCELCRACPGTPEEKESAHLLVDELRSQMRECPFSVKLELATFADKHGSALFEKRTKENHLPPHLRLAYK